MIVLYEGIMAMSHDLAHNDILQPGDALTDGDRETISHLLRAGAGRNTLRAVRSDLAYLEAWSLACDGEQLSWPPDQGRILRFIAHHLWDEEERTRDPSHGMPGHVEEMLRRSGFLRSSGPHAPSTVRRRMSTWRSVCRLRSASDPFADAVVRRTLASAVRVSRRPRQRKSRSAVDLAVLLRLTEHLSARCTERPLGDRELDRLRLAALRDRAMISCAFAAGGRRRSEISSLNCAQLVHGDPVRNEETGQDMPSLAIRIGRTKTTDADDGEIVYMSGSPVVFLTKWMAAASISTGQVFRRIDRWGRVHDTGIGETALNMILKARLTEIGEDPAKFSAHGLRSGFITEAFAQGISPQDVMNQTLHRSMRTAMSYYNDANRRTGRAARLMG